MKTIYSAIFTIICSIFISHVSLAAETPFIIADDDDFAPFCWADKKDNTIIKGISYEIITEAFKLMGKPLKYTALPWGRVTGTLQAEDYAGVDATVTIHTDLRKQFLVASKNPIIVTNYSIFTRANHPKFNQMKKIKKIEDLKEYKIVDYLGDGWAESHFKKEEGYNVEFAPALDNTLRILSDESRQLDLFVQSEMIAQYNIKNFGFEKKLVKVPGVSLGSETFSLLIHKKSPKLAWLKEFDAAMVKMKKSGRIKAIYKKYLEN